MSSPFRGLIDSGAYRCVFDAEFCRSLNIELRSGHAELTGGLSGEEVVWLHNVQLITALGTFTIEAGFKEDLPVPGVLGMNGFFDQHTITFRSDLRTVEMERVFTA